MEILIVLAIITVLAFLGTNMVRGSFRSKARELSWRMASTIRYLYNSAITENKTVRLVFDFENNSYWAESTSERFLLEKTESAKGKESKKEEEPKKEEGSGEEGSASNKLKPAEAVFGSMDTPLIETRALSAGIYLKDIYTTHDPEAVSNGKAYIYFFPSGQAEAAIINFRDEPDEKHISIKIDPFSADTDISAEYRRPEETSKK